MVSAEPRKLSVAIFLMKRGTSMWVGQAAVHGTRRSGFGTRVVRREFHFAHSKLLIQ
jgi:hypothetical protein